MNSMKIDLRNLNRDMEAAEEAVEALTDAFKAIADALAEAEDAWESLPDWFRESVAVKGGLQITLTIGGPS